MRRQNHFSRRGFSALLMGGVACAFAGKHRIRNGLQLFSVRGECERDLPKTLAAIRSFGYEGVEFAGFYGWRSQPVRELLEQTSLAVCGSHTPLDQLLGDRFAETVAFSQVLGNRNLIVPGLPPPYCHPGGWERAADLINQIAERLRPFKMHVGYHNHAIEFQRIGAQRPWDLLIGRTDASVIMQVDLGNSRVAGVDPIALLREYPGRAASIHVKDWLPGEPDALIGTGNFNWHEFCRVCERIAGTKWYIVEHESKTQPSLAAVAESLKRFQTLRAG
jgi:sugar phosphate isomerase/epimerase